MRLGNLWYPISLGVSTGLGLAELVLHPVARWFVHGLWGL